MTAFAALRGRIACTPVYSRLFPATVVLLYHRVAEVDRSGGYRLAVRGDNLRSQLDALRRALPPLRLRDAAAALRRGRPARGFVVTFDDGYADNLDALPILEEFEVPATVFVTAGATGGQFPWELPLREPERGSAMTVDELRELAASPLVEIGAHTVSHPRLSELGLDEQRREIADGRTQLEELLNLRVEGFAYPYGDFRSETVEIVRELGFGYACATATGRAGRGSDVFAIPRFRPGDWHGAELWARLERMLYLPRSKRPRNPV